MHLTGEKHCEGKERYALLINGSHLCVESLLKKQGRISQSSIEPNSFLKPNKSSQKLELNVKDDLWESKAQLPASAAAEKEMH